MLQQRNIRSSPSLSPRIIWLVQKTERALLRIYFHPYLKKSHKDSASIYRPVSFTSIAYKVMKGICRDVMLDFLQPKPLLSTFSKALEVDAFQLLHSLITIITLQLCKWLDGKADIDMILFDFPKTFDSLSHSLFLVKLRTCSININNRLLLWLTDFFQF